jgi:hypothetical protein
MWIQVSDAELATLGRTIDGDYHLTDKERTIVSTAIERDGELELDDKVVASRGAENGMYVQAWIWVAFPDCATCSAPTEDLTHTYCFGCAEETPDEND